MDIKRVIRNGFPIFSYISLTIHSVYISRPENCGVRPSIGRYSFLIWFLFGVYPLVTYLIALFSGVEKRIPYVFAVWLVAVIPAAFSADFIDEQIQKHGPSTLSVALIVDTKGSYKTSKLSFKVESYDHVYTEILRGGSLDDKNIGDTIIVFYDEDCPRVCRLYKLNPTPEEKEKCKNGCYVEHGEIFSNIE